MTKLNKVFSFLLFILSWSATWGQSCPKEPPFPNTNDINEVIATCKKYGGTWTGDQYGGCKFPPDWCTKSQANTTASMPLPRNMQEFSTELFAATATAWFNGMADKMKSDAARAQQLKAERAQQAEMQRQREAQHRQAIIQHLLGTDTGNNALQLVFDDSSLGVKRKAGAPQGRPGDLQLVFDDSALGVKRAKAAQTGVAQGYGINGLPGVYTNGPADGNGSAGGYGINGLPGVYTGGPADANIAPAVVNRARMQSSIEGLPGVYLDHQEAAKKPGDGGEQAPEPKSEGYGIAGLPGVYTGGARESQPVAEANVQAAIPIGSPNADEPSAAAKTLPKDSTPAMQQLQQVAEDSKTAVSAGTAEEAAARASEPFDQNSPAVDMRDARTNIVDPAKVRGERPRSAVSVPETRSAVSIAKMTPPPGPDIAVHETSPTPRAATRGSGGGSNGGGARPTASGADPNGAARPLAELVRSEAMARSGMLEKHAQEMCDFVQESCHGTIIMQNVNPGATQWMKSGKVHPKPMWLKAKSSDHPEIAGLIPCDQAADGKIKDRAQLEEADQSVVSCLKLGRCKCVDKAGVQVLADADGELYVSDYDPYLIRCEGDKGPATTGSLGFGTDNERKVVKNFNRLYPDAAMQHLAMSETGGKPSLPATAFTYDPQTDRCQVKSLNSEQDVRQYLREHGLKASISEQ